MNFSIKKSILFLLVIFLGTIYFFIENDNYRWISREDKDNYKNISWTKIESQKLAGFTPYTVIEEKSSSKQYPEPLTEELVLQMKNEEGSYLRREGGLNGVYYRLQEITATSTKYIFSVKKLKEKFLPVDNEAEAVSFVFVTKPDLNVKDGNVPDGYVAKIPSGYLVKALAKNTYGCGSHKPSYVIYKVLESGEIKAVAFEKKIQIIPRFITICAD